MAGQESQVPLLPEQQIPSKLRQLFAGQEISPEMLRLLEELVEDDEMVEGDETVVTLGATNLVKRKHEIPDDLYADVSYIFHTSYVSAIDRELRPFLYRRKPDEFEQQLELPRRLPSIRDFSGKLVLVYEFFPTAGCQSVMVFLIDWCTRTRKVSLFHVFTRMFKDMSYRTCGYAAIGERFYIVGGCYIDPDGTTPLDKALELVELETRKSESEGSEPLYSDEYDALIKVQSTWPEHLDIPTYNLRTAKWEMGTPSLNGAKINPVVFVYEGKIFAIRGDHAYNRENAPKFELLDLNCSPRCWVDLPAPPCDMKYYWYHILDEANGILFLFFQTYSASIYFERYDEDDYPCCQLNLK